MKNILILFFMVIFFKVISEPELIENKKPRKPLSEIYRSN